jgi:hypothetical protein
MLEFNPFTAQNSVFIVTGSESIKYGLANRKAGA